MDRLSPFPISKRWPARNPRIIQLYSVPTPNGVKVSIALEELGLPYEAHAVSFSDNEQKSAEFLSLNPNGKIPAIIDPDGPDGDAVGLFESGAILIYLAEKTGRLMPNDPIGRYETIQWVFFQVGGVGPMFGQFGHFFKFAADKIAGNPYPMERYRDETRRLLAVLEERLQGRPWLMGEEYTIADIATFPWVRGLDVFYKAGDVLGLDDFVAVRDWVARASNRPASVAGLEIPKRG
ncbi:glutathione S-transferase family protein [Rhizobium sp. PAMB 3174]